MREYSLYTYRTAFDHLAVQNAQLRFDNAQLRSLLNGGNESMKPPNKPIKTTKRGPRNVPKTLTEPQPLPERPLPFEGIPADVLWRRYWRGELKPAKKEPIVVHWKDMKKKIRKGKKG